MIHAGHLIKQVLCKKGRTVTWFASKMNCTRTNIYKIFHKNNLDVDILWRASCILNYDLFSHISQELQMETRCKCIQNGNCIQSGNKKNK